MLTFCLWMKAEEFAISSLKRAFGALNTHLASNTYLVGHSVTLADIIMACNLSYGFKTVLTKNFTKEFPHVERYFWTVVNQPKFHKILGDIEQSESVPPVASKKPAAQPKEPAKPKAKEEPKKAAKKEEPKPNEDLEEEEAPKPKAKNPLDLLPPSKMVLDEWKRLYSNTKSNFREVAIDNGNSLPNPLAQFSKHVQTSHYWLDCLFSCTICFVVHYLHLFKAGFVQLCKFLFAFPFSSWLFLLVI